MTHVPHAPPGRWLFRIGMVTDPGRQREANEDAMAALVPWAGAPSVGRVDAFFLVADGMGGHEGGDRASAFVAHRIRTWIEEGADGASELRFMEELEGLLVETNRELVALGREEGLATGTGSTVTIGCVRDQQLHIAHVGDSRLYRLRGGLMEQLTEDHSWVAEQQRAGILNAEAIARHPARHMLTECMGVGMQLRVFTRTVRIEAGDRLLLCTDGLHGPVPESEVARVLETEPDPQGAARTLVALANERSGPDNITAVVVHIAPRPQGDPLAETLPMELPPQPHPEHLSHERPPSEPSVPTEEATPTGRTEHEEGER